MILLMIGFFLFGIGNACFVFKKETSKQERLVHFTLMVLCFIAAIEILITKL